MADGDSTDYDSLPSPPIRATASSRGGKAARRYGRKAARVLPRSPPPRKAGKAFAARGGGGRGKTGKRTERGKSSGSDEEEGRGKVVKVKRVKGNAVKGKSRAKEDEEEADGESGAEEGGEDAKKRSAKEDKARKRPVAETASRAPSPPPIEDAVLPPTVAKPPTSRAHKRPRDAPPAQPAEQPAAPVPPTPPRPPPQRQQRKTHPAVLEAQAQDGPWANMTPRSRARALGDKSNRPSVAGPGGGAGGGRPSQGRPSLPLSPGGRTVDSPRSRTQSRRGSLALPPSPFGVFRDPAPPSLSLPLNQHNAAPAYPSLPPPTLIDLPPRRRPLLRAASASLSAPPSAHPSIGPQPPLSARSTLSLPRSPGSSASQSRLPRAARAFALPRSAPPSSLLAVPGGPPAGQVPRLPPPWSLIAPPTSSPASVAPAGGEGQVGEGEEAEQQPVFRFTTTQFADLPSLSLSSTRPVHFDGEKGTIQGGRGDDSALVGMESSFMLETFEGSGMFEDETVTMEEQEKEMETSGDGTMEGQEEEEDEGDVTIRAIEVDEKEEEEGTTGEATEMATGTHPSRDTAMKAAESEEEGAAEASVASDDEGETTVGLANDLDADVSLALPSSPSFASFSPPSAIDKVLGPHPPPLAYSATFMPPRRPRPPISPTLPSGPPSDEDDLAYYLRTTGTFSSEDDLPPSPSEELDSSAEEDRLAEREVGRAVKATSGQREKRIEASEEARRVREARRAVKGLRIGEGKDGRRKGWRRVVLGPRAARGTRWNKVEGVVDDGYEADQGEVEGEEGDEEDELAMSFG